MKREKEPAPGGETPSPTPARPRGSNGGSGHERRVLIVAPQPFFQDRGTPIALEQVLRALSRLGYRSDVLTFPGGTSPNIPGVEYHRIRKLPGFQPVSIGFSFGKLGLDFLLFAALKKMIRRTDYYCIHAVEEAGFLAVLAARRSNTPVVYDMQSSLAEQMGRKFLLRNHLARSLLDSLERWLIRRATCTLHSAGLEERTAAAAIPGRTRAWKFPPSLPLSSKRRDEVKASLEIDAKRQVVLYTGNFSDYQGIPELLTACAHVHLSFPDTLFVLIGATQRESERAGEQLGHSLPPSSYRIMGRRPAGEIASWLAAADVVVSPRTFGTNFPLKVIEYLSAGKAIVATRIPAHTCILDEDTAVLVDPNAAGIAAGIAELLGNDQRRRHFEAAGLELAGRDFNTDAFHAMLMKTYDGLAPRLDSTGDCVSVIIPARNCASFIARTVRSVSQQLCGQIEKEIIVVDDGSTDNTAEVARAAGARVVRIEGSGNPATARNTGAKKATGDPVVFLDADCTARPGWLQALLDGHSDGSVCVGGSLGLPSGLAPSARWDYYTGWYHVHPERPAGAVPNHPPCNISVRRAAFASTSGFVEREPIAYSHEELQWQADLASRGHQIKFQPSAIVDHWNRPGFGNMLRRNYRWAYGALESKAETGAARLQWLYRFPLTLIVTGVLLAPAQAVYVTWCWLKVGRLEPLITFPVVLAARFAYAAGMAVGGWKWLRRRGTTGTSGAPRWQ